MQGTPYFNFYKGEVEYKAMSLIGYDAGTLGNHEFDNGVEALAKALQFADFDIISTNYDVRGSLLEKKVKTHSVKVVGGVRVGCRMGIVRKIDYARNFSGSGYRAVRMAAAW